VLWAEELRKAAAWRQRGGLGASWEVDLFGAKAAAVRAAQADVDAAAASVQATRLAIAAEAALAYVQWQGARAQLAAARASLASQLQTLQLVRWKRQAGVVAEPELQTAQASTEQARAREQALVQALVNGEHALAVLLGQPPAALADRLAASPARQPEAPALGIQALPAELLQRRPDLRAAAHRIESALATRMQKEADRRPSVTLSGSLGLQAATWSALSGPGALLAGLVAGIHWPLLDGGAGAAQLAAQQASVDAAALAWRAAVLAALQDVEDALVARDSAARRVAALGRAADAAHEALSLARQRWQVGLAELSALLESERGALNAADSLAAARSDFAAAHIRLYKALGGSAGSTLSIARP
jgi:multidrug efflux system outer membrane protein